MASLAQRLAGYRDPGIAARVVQRIRERPPTPVTLMEVCGTHTVTIFRHGIRELLPDNVKLVSGPGCPVCVTAGADLDRAISIARQPGVILTTFGDMMRVPGRLGSLQAARAEGCDVRVVYSAMDAAQIARENPDRSTVFLGVGFETTAPTIASSILQAGRLGLPNYSVLSVHKVMPPALRALVSMGELRLDGLICPGHVSAVIGSKPYQFVAREHGIPCVIAGFEPVDVLLAIDMLLAQKVDGRSEVEIQYSRVVRPEGNRVAQELMARVFKPADVEWRGLGTIPGSGLRMREEYSAMDATRRFDLQDGPGEEDSACRCGEVLRGVISPPECALYGSACSPDTPIGPCMVSSEGTCSSWYQFSEAT